MTILSPAVVDDLEKVFSPRGRRGRSEKVRGRQIDRAMGEFAGLADRSPATDRAGFGVGPGRSGRALDQLQRTAGKSPEAVVKITGRQQGSGHTLANFTYIARTGWGKEQEGELLTSEDQVLTSAEQMKTLAKEWQAWHDGDEVRRKGATSMSIVLSMPAATDPEKVRSAGVAFAREVMGDRRWVLALHTETGHPHVHLTVARRADDGSRINPLKEDLRRYRGVFATKLRQQGLEANATPRMARGLVQKGEKGLQRRIRERERANGGPGQEVRHSRVGRLLRAEIAERVERGVLETTMDRRLLDRQRTVQSIFARALKELVESRDPDAMALARSVGDLVKGMPRAETRATTIVRAVKSARRRHEYRSKGPSR